MQVLEHNGVEVRAARQRRCAAACRSSTAAISTPPPEDARATSRCSPTWSSAGYAVVDPVAELQPHGARGVSAARRRRARPRGWRQHAHDLDEYLYRIAREGRLKRDFKRRFGHVQYHVPCHIRVQNIGIRGRDLLKLVADEVDAVQECSGHDGTWSMQKENFDDSLRWGEKAFAGMRHGRRRAVRARLHRLPPRRAAPASRGPGGRPCTRWWRWRTPTVSRSGRGDRARRRSVGAGERWRGEGAAASPLARRRAGSTAPARRRSSVAPG